MGICLDRQRMEGRQARTGTQGRPELFLHCPPPTRIGVSAQSEDKEIPGSSRGWVSAPTGTRGQGPGWGRVPVPFPKARGTARFPKSC